MKRSHRENRIAQIDQALEEYQDAIIIIRAIDSGNSMFDKTSKKTQICYLTGKVSELLEEREKLENNSDHWLADTKPSIKPVSDAVQRDIQNSRKTMRVQDDF